MPPGTRKAQLLRSFKLMHRTPVMASKKSKKHEDLPQKQNNIVVDRVTEALCACY
jgi:hypothetical protein